MRLLAPVGALLLRHCAPYQRTISAIRSGEALRAVYSEHERQALTQVEIDAMQLSGIPGHLPRAMRGQRGGLWPITPPVSQTR